MTSWNSPVTSISPTGLKLFMQHLTSRNGLATGTSGNMWSLHSHYNLIPTRRTRANDTRIDRDIYRTPFGDRFAVLMEEIRGPIHLSHAFADLLFRAQTHSPGISSTGSRADVPIDFHQDRRVSGGLCLLPESAHYDADVERQGLLDPQHVISWRGMRPVAVSLSVLHWSGMARSPERARVR